MAIEGPVAVAIIARKPEAVIGTAAFNVLMAMAIWLESPVIDLLSTGTALGKGGRAYRTLNLFTKSTMVWVTVAHAIVAIPAVFAFVTRTVLGLRPEVASAVWLPFAIMIPWSAMVGWRRFRQGLMIRRGQTRVIGVGTFIRVTTLCMVGAILMATTSWSGIVIAAVGLLASVTAEAVFMHFASQRVIAEMKAEDEANQEPLTFRQVLRFHAPLTGATLVTLTSLPVVSAALSRTPDAVLALAAWQVAFTLQWLFRTVTFAIPEVVISFMKTPAEEPVLRRFSFGIGVALSLAMALFALSGLDRVVFARVLGAGPELFELAHLALLICSPFPLINAVMAYSRGVLTARRKTSARLTAIVVSMVVLIGSLAVGVAARWPGIVTASVALLLAQVAEWAVLRAAVERSHHHELAPA